MIAMHHRVPLGGAKPKTHSVLSSALATLGAFCLVAALLFRVFVPGQAERFPLNEYEVMTLQGTGVSYFSAARLSELSGVTMRATYTIKGDATLANATRNSNIAVWRSFTAVEDMTHHAPFSYQYALLPFNRKTGVLINCCDAVVGTHHQLHLGGQGYVWPFGTQKRDYQVFDTTVLKPVTFRYAGTATTDGMLTYRFVESVTSQQIGTQTLPASLLGMSGSSVTLPEFYAATNTYWVDPVTGDPLKISENQRLTLQDSSGATRLVLFQGHLTTTPASVRTVAAPDRVNVTKIHLMGTVIPITGGALGLVLLAIGIMLRRRPRPGYEEEEHEDEAPAPSLV
jgi:Porin PorA